VFEDDRSLIADLFPAQTVGTGGNKLKKKLIIRVIDNGLAGAHRGQDIHLIMEKRGQFRIGADPATGSEAHEPLFADQIRGDHRPGLQQLLQRIQQLLFAPVTMATLHKHLMTALQKMLEKLLLLAYIIIDDYGMGDLNPVHHLHPVNDERMPALQLVNLAQILRRGRQKRP